MKMGKNKESFKRVRKILLDITEGEIDIEEFTGDEELNLYGLDSLKFIKLIIEIEEVFRIEIEDEMFIFENFNTVNKILQYLDKVQ